MRKVKRRIGLLLLVVTLMMGCSFCFGAAFEQAKWDEEEYASPVTLDEGLMIVARARRSHQWYVDNPSRIRVVETYPPLTLEFHKECVERYDQLRQLLLTLAKKEGHRD